MFALVGSRFTLITSIVAHLFAPAQPARLSPGIYATGSLSHVQIVRMGQRYCLAATSRSETTVASIRPDRKRPNFYQVNGFPGIAISQQDSNTILWGSPSQRIRGVRDRQKEQANLPIREDLQRCLSSNQPFFSKGKG